MSPRTPSGESSAVHVIFAAACDIIVKCLPTSYAYSVCSETESPWPVCPLCTAGWGDLQQNGTHISILAATCICNTTRVTIAPIACSSETQIIYRCSCILTSWERLHICNLCNFFSLGAGKTARGQRSRLLACSAVCKLLCNARALSY